MLGTVDKVGRVMALFHGAPEWGVTEVARALDMPKSSAHSLLASLAGTGLLGRTEENRYRLSWSLLGLSRTLLDSADVLSHAQPAIRSLTRRFGLTVHVATLDHDQVICLEKVGGQRQLPATGSEVGRRLPAHCTALGKVLLAHATEGALDQVLATHGLPAMTERTITSPEALSSELSEIRRRGWARAGEETVAGLCCYAAPIYGRRMRIQAAISVSVSVADDCANRDRYAPLAVAAGTSASRKLRATQTGSPENRPIRRELAVAAAA